MLVGVDVNGLKDIEDGGVTKLKGPAHMAKKDPKYLDLLLISECLRGQI